jgi:hypothetical protein
MAGSDITRQYDLSDQSNDLVPLMLGALSWADRFIAAAEASTNGNFDVQDVAPDPMLAAALGLISLRRTLLRWALHAAGDHASVPAMPPAPHPPGSLLR